MSPHLKLSTLFPILSVYFCYQIIVKPESKLFKGTSVVKGFFVGEVLGARFVWKVVGSFV